MRIKREDTSIFPASFQAGFRRLVPWRIGERINRIPHVSINRIAGNEKFFRGQADVAAGFVKVIALGAHDTCAMESHA
jgi:hypothetical protein